MDLAINIKDQDPISVLKESVSETHASVHKKRKFRRTNDFDVEELTDVNNHICKSYKEKQRNSFLPKIDDVKLTSSYLSNPLLPISSNNKKKVKSLKFYKQKIETQYGIKSSNNRIQSLKLRKAKGVWTPVKCENNMKCNLYIPLIPLEKTDLLNEHQLRQLMCFKFTNSKKEEDLLKFCRPCFVILKRLSEEEINTALNQKHNIDVQYLNETFNPYLTSSPNIASDFSDDENINKSIIQIKDISTNLERVTDDLTTINVNKSTDGSIIEINSSTDLTIDLKDVAKKLVWNDVPSLGGDENLDNPLNRTYDIEPIQDQKKTPKSVLKSNHKSPTNNNRRVTFNDTSIIIHDSDTLYTSSTPTHFEEDCIDTGRKRKSSIYHMKELAGRTPAVLKNANKNEYSSVDINGSKKKTRMPDFAKIHKRMFDGMLDIKQHAENKLKRSQLLLSGRKPNAGTRKLNGDHLSSVTMNLKKHMKKVLVDKPNSGQQSVIKKDQLDIKEKKSSILRKQQAHAITNKLRANQTSSRENNKQYVKGIRTNRRFELLMNLRKNQQKK